MFFVSGDSAGTDRYASLTARRRLHGLGFDFASVAQPAESRGGAGIFPEDGCQHRTAKVDKDGNVVLDLTSLFQHVAALLPDRILGLGLTALLAVYVGHGWQRHGFQYCLDLRHLPVVHPAQCQRRTLPHDGRLATVFGIALSVVAAYAATRFTTSWTCATRLRFVNAPLFATFLLGCSGTRARPRRICGMISGTTAAASHHGLTLPAGAVPGIKGGWLGVVAHQYPSEMAQNFWTAIWAWFTCFVVTIFISLLTKPRRKRNWSDSFIR